MEEENRTFTVTFPTVGPISRATVGDGDPEPRLDRLLDLLRWTWGCTVQLRRLKRSLLADWFGRDSLTRLEKTKKVCMSEFDEHLLAVAIGNLAKAQGRAHRYYKHLNFSDDLLQALTCLRDVYEHWEQHRRVYRDKSRPKIKAAHDLAQRFPKGRPWTVDLDPEAGDFVLAGLVSVKRLETELRSFYKQIAEEWKQLEAANPGHQADG